MKVEYVEHEERSTSYRLLFTELPKEAKEREGGKIAISLFSPRQSTYAFNGEYTHWSYIMEKFKVSEVDAKIIAKLITETLPWFND